MTGCSPDLALTRSSTEDDSEDSVSDHQNHRLCCSVWIPICDVATHTKEAETEIGVSDGLLSYHLASLGLYHG